MQFNDRLASSLYIQKGQTPEWSLVLNYYDTVGEKGSTFTACVFAW